MIFEMNHLIWKVVIELNHSIKMQLLEFKSVIFFLSTRLNMCFGFSKNHLNAMVLLSTYVLV